jgi:hypothetical protein
MVKTDFMFMKQKTIFRHFSLLIMLVVSIQTIGQSTSGFSGYFGIPSADLSPDKSVTIGYHQLNKKYYSGFYDGKYDLDVGFIDIGFLPILELGIRITRPRGFETDKKTTWDRMIAVRGLPVKETKYFPAVVIGFQGFYTTAEGKGASYFNSTYVVLTKNIPFNKLLKNLGLTLGYGSDIIPANTYQYLGFFGGIKITPHHLKFLEIMLDYDADKWNAGVRVTILKHLILLAGYEGLDAFSGGVSYRFTLP